MDAIIDSNAFGSDPLLQGRKWQILGKWLQCENARVVTPGIAIDEAARRFRQGLENAGKDVDRGLKHIAKLLPEHTDWRLPPIHLAEEEIGYRKSLSSRLQELRIRQEDLTGALLTTCDGRTVKGAIMREMMFRLLDGTQDAISVITDNAGEFGRPGALAPDLENELNQRGIPIERVTIFKDLFTFVKNYVLPRLHGFDDIVGRIATGRHDDLNLNELYTEKHDEFFVALTEFVDDFGRCRGHFNTATFGSPELAHLADVSEQTCFDAWQDKDGRLSIFVVFLADGAVRCRLKSRGKEGYVSGRLTFDVQTSILFNPHSGQVEEFEIGDLGYELWRDEWPGLDDESK